MSKMTYNIDVNNLLQLPANVYYLDKDCRVLGFNAPTAKLFNLHPNECVGLDYDEMAKIGKWNNGQGVFYYNTDTEIMSNNQPRIGVIELPIPHPDGSIKTYVSTRLPLCDQNKKVVGILGISVEVKNASPLHPNSLKKHFKHSLITAKRNTYNLSAQQIECLLWLTKGMTTKQIAKAMSLSPRTIESYLETIKIKLTCSSRTELIQYALQIPEIKSQL